MTAKIGDTVRFLNDVGGGKVVKIQGNMAYVADEDGFETPMLLRECVVIDNAPAAPAKYEAVVRLATTTPAPASKAADPEPAAEEEPIEETAGGDVLNVVLGFEAHDLKQLSRSGFDAFIVNDSNYYLYFTFATRKEDASSWTTRYAGVVEPNFQLLIAELNASDLPEIERIAVQIIAFKRDKEFALKQPVAYESRLDTTKFARLHCFRDNIYFDNPVIAIDLVKDDQPQRGALSIALPEAEPAVTARRPDHAPGHRRPVSKKAQKNVDPLVVDLHIGELIDSTAGLSNADMLNYQVDKFREIMDANMRFGGRKIIFIHGKGEGVLRQALLKELKYRYSGCTVQDASFREYGYGATQVTINPRRQ